MSPPSNPIDRLAEALRDLICDALRDAVRELAGHDERAPTPVTWRTRLWDAPEDTLLSTDDVAEALGRSRAFVHRRCRRIGDDEPLPYRLLDGHRVFTAGAVRDWIRRALDAGEAPYAY